MLSKKKLISILLLILLIVLLINPFIKEYTRYKINEYFPRFKIRYFDYSLNNTFSLILVNSDNVIKIYGRIYPLSALFEANINNLSKLNQNFNGKIQIKGKIIDKNGKYKIKGVAYFADGYLNFDTYLGKNEAFKGEGNYFDIQKLLKIIKIKYPYINGITTLKIKKNKNIKIIANTTGEYKNKIKTNFQALTNITIDKNIKFTTQIDSPFSNIQAIGFYNKVLSINKFKANNVHLLYLKSYLLYPFKSEVNISGSYDGVNNILKFFGDNCQGFKTNHIEVTFNLKSKNFFKYIGLNDILRGDISGVIKIKDDKGNFDIVSYDNVFLTTDFTKKIDRLTGINLRNYKFKNIFIKGNFNSNALVFNLFSNISNVTINIKQGKFIYPNHYKIVLNIKQKNNFFKILIKDGNYKLLRKSFIKNVQKEILVY